MVVNPLIENEQILSCIGFALLVLRSVAISVAKISGTSCPNVFPPGPSIMEGFFIYCLTSSGVSQVGKPRIY